MSRTLRHSERARGQNQGGCGGGYEPTDPDYDEKRLRQLRTTTMAWTRAGTRRSWTSEPVRTGVR